MLRGKLSKNVSLSIWYWLIVYRISAFVSSRLLRCLSNSGYLNMILIREFMTAFGAYRYVSRDFMASNLMSKNAKPLIRYDNG